MKSAKNSKNKKNLSNYDPKFNKQFLIPNNESQELTKPSK